MQQKTLAYFFKFVYTLAQSEFHEWEDYTVHCPTVLVRQQQQGMHQFFTTEAAFLFCVNIDEARGDAAEASMCLFSSVCVYFKVVN